MTKRSIEIVLQKQKDHPATKPNTFWIAGRSAEGALRLGVFVGFLGFFGGVGGRRGLLIRGLRFGGLRGCYRNDGGDTGGGKTNRNAETAD